MTIGDGSHGATRRGASRVAMIGYGPEARDQALRSRALGWGVDVVVRPGGMTWIRAVQDGFRPVPAAEAAARADVVAVHLPESEQAAVWAYGIAPHVRSGALVVFAHGSALYLGAVEPDASLDVVLVAKRSPAKVSTASTSSPSEKTGHYDVAVHRDATGRALERALAYTQAVVGASKIGTTTIAAEVRADLTGLVAKMGGLSALLADWDRVLANPSHEPDEATLTYYERLRAAVLAERGRAATVVRAPSSGVELSRGADRRAARKQGAA